MKKVCIAGLAVLLSMAFVPTAPAQIPSEVNNLLCSLGVGNLLPGDGTFSGTHTATSSYNSPGSAPAVQVFSFCGAEGDDIVFSVDNVDTPSDLWACVTAAPDDPCVPAFWNDFLFDLGGDDEIGCSVPHFFGCPAGEAPLPADDGDGVFYIRVGTWASVGGYSGSLTVNGAGVMISPA